jgi:hypothetical protein
MLRPLTLIGTATALALAVTSVDADDPSNCPTCNNSGAYAATEWTETSGIIYDDCEQCDASGGSGCSLCSSKGWPDRGWNPPAQYPVNRDGIWYRNMWPQAWYGNPGGGFIANAPMVYQPTDTTQLGYSYAKVPTWQSIRMIPPTPNPSNFHARVCVPRPHPGRLIDGCPSGNPCSGTTRYGYGGYGAGSSCPSCQQGQAAYGDGAQPHAGLQTPGAPAAQQSATPTPPQEPNLAIPPQQYQQVSYAKDETPGLFSMAALRNLFN